MAKMATPTTEAQSVNPILCGEPIVAASLHNETVFVQIGNDVHVTAKKPEYHPLSAFFRLPRPNPLRTRTSYVPLVPTQKAHHIWKTSLSEVASETKPTEATEWQTTKRESTGLEKRVAAKCATAVTAM